MFVQHPMHNAVVGKFLLIASVWLLGVSTVSGQFPGGGMGGMGRGLGGRHGSDDKEKQSKKAENKTSENPQKDDPLPPHFHLTRHGGLYLTPEWSTYEVVFLPYQTRIYFYDKNGTLSAKDVHAKMSFQLPAENNAIRIPFQYVAPPAGSTEQDYVAANFNAMQSLHETEMPITIEFSDLPDRHHPKASFTPFVSQSQIRRYVAQVLLTPADRDGVFRQRTCPVCGKVLGREGQISKVLIGDEPLYLCGDGCVAPVQAAPEKYSPRPAVSQER